MPADRNDAGGSRYADKTYEVGKGKPPKEHRFKPGNKLGGRKAGSRNRTDFDKLMDERVTVGEDRLGRPIRKAWREVVNRQLLQKAGRGDLAAIRIVKEFELKHAALARSFAPAGPTPAEIALAEREEAEKRALAAKFVRLLENAASAKRGDVPRMEYRAGKLVPVQDANQIEAEPPT